MLNLRIGMGKVCASFLEQRTRMELISSKSMLKTCAELGLARTFGSSTSTNHQ